jgi:hypothetical protein
MVYYSELPNPKMPLVVRVIEGRDESVDEVREHPLFLAFVTPKAIARVDVGLMWGLLGCVD